LRVVAAEPEPDKQRPDLRSALGLPFGKPGFALSSSLVVVLLALLAIFQWKIAVVDTAYESGRATDLFKEHMPTVIAGFGAWREGRLALWNPDQLAGVPFMAVPYTGLLYPGNLGLLLSDDLAQAVDATQIAHLVFGGLCMAWLVRALEMGWAPAIAAALTFMLSGMMVSFSRLPVLIHGMVWLPATVLAVERTLGKRRLGPVVLALAVAMQILAGATEYVVYNLYAAGLYALFRIAAAPRERGALTAATPLALLAVSVGLGVALAGAQLLPSLELVSQSARAGGVSLGEALYTGTLPLAQLAWLSATTAGIVSVGSLPIVGLFLGHGGASRRPSELWLYAVFLIAVSALLAAGGALFEIYFDTPIGKVFRRPNKLLHLFSFAAALLAALALARLERWREEGRAGAALWRSPAWLGALGLVALACGWVAVEGSLNAPLIAVLLLLLCFGLFANPAVRALAIAALLLVHAWDLLSTEYSQPERPSARMPLLYTESALFDWLEERRGDGRVHVSPRFHKRHGLTLKQGMLRGIPVLMDQQPLAMERHGRFFELASGGTRFLQGQAVLRTSARLDLLDLASVRFYVLKPGMSFERLMAKRALRAKGSIRLVRETGRYRVYERDRWLPRAYAVPEARTLRTPHHVLAALRLAEFDARREVLLEAVPGSLPASTESSGPSRPADGFAPTVRIVSDEAERMVVEADLERPGHLVVTDSWYPGWRATVNGTQTPIRRANYLFRSVPLPAGASRVVFEYAPASFRLGAVISALAALALVGLALVRRSSR
jgi:hypothetical protein